MAQTLEMIDEWPVDHAAASIVGPGEATFHGDEDRVFPLASVTKPIVAYAVLVAVEEESLSLDDPVGPPGATVRHLLAHTAGYGFDYGSPVLSPVGKRRIYSNEGYQILGDYLAAATGMPLADYVFEAVCQPLGMGSCWIEGRPGSGAVGSVRDVAWFTSELLKPRLLDKATIADATTVQFPGLNGPLPGFGTQRPNDWGLGFEIRGRKSPHWTGTQNSPRTFGHFGAAGTFFWVDPVRSVGAVALTDREFGPWAKEAWPVFSDAVLAQHWR